MITMEQMNISSILDNALSTKSNNKLAKPINITNLYDIEPILSKSIYYTHNDYSIICRYNNNFSIKIILYDIDGNSYENGEIDILLILSKLVVDNNTPHIIIPLIYGYTFININNIYKLSYSKLKDIYNKYLDNRIDNKALIVISEWCKYTDLRQFIKNRNIENDEWCIILFKIIFTLAIINEKYPGFRHNDLSFKNILVGKNITQGSSIYYYNNTYYKIPNTDYQIYLWDFEYSNIIDILDNIDIYPEMIQKYGIRKNSNQYYDLHFLLNSTYFNIKPPIYVRDFIEQIIPKDHLAISSEILTDYRLLPDIEYTTPQKVLKHVFFNHLIIEKSSITTHINNVYNYSPSV